LRYFDDLLALFREVYSPPASKLFLAGGQARQYACPPACPPKHFVYRLLNAKEGLPTETLSLLSVECEGVAYLSGIFWMEMT